MRILKKKKKESQSIYVKNESFQVNYIDFVKLN